MKTGLSILAIFLTCAGHIPYLRDVIIGKTKPHVYSWFIWGLVTAIAAALQFAGGGGPGAWVTAVGALVCTVTFILSIPHGKSNITKHDTVLLCLAMVALGFWLLAKQPILSLVLITTIDLMGLIPTIRKSWHKPHEETLNTYAINVLRISLSLLALRQYSVLTVLYPATWALASAMFSIFLWVRRIQLSTNVNGATAEAS